MNREREFAAMYGGGPLIGIIFVFLLIPVSIALVPEPEVIGACVVVGILNIFAAKGLFIVNPNVFS